MNESENILNEVKKKKKIKENERVIVIDDETVKGTMESFSEYSMKNPESKEWGFGRI